MLEFSPDTHTYTHNGKQVPSVTQVIAQWVKVGGWYVNTFSGASIPAETFEAAGKFGTDAHTMIAYYLEGDLDEDSLTPELSAVFNQFIAWKTTMKPEVIDFEKRLCHEKYGFAGTYDLKCRIGRHLYIIDWKTGDFAMAGPQLAAYVELDKAADKSRATRKRAVVLFSKNGGTYRHVEMANPSDWHFFVSRLNQYNYLNGRK